jgi:type II secretory pathway predicted ATPase ExeA
MLCRVLMERLPEHVVTIYLANPSLSREEILYALADELDIAVPELSRANTLMRVLQDKLVSLYAAGKQVIVLIDEAHAMPKETLEEVRLLSNLESSRHKLLQLVLFGQPEINETLARSDMRQLRDRITHNFGLEPLVREDIAQYLDFRMRAAGYRGPSIFTPTAIKLIAAASQGLTRRINILADKALLAAFVAGRHQVGQHEIKAAIRDSEFASIQTRKVDQLSANPLLWAGAGALVMLAVVGIWFQASQPVADIAPVTTAPATQSAPAVAEMKPDQTLQLAFPLKLETSPPDPLDAAPLAVQKHIQPAARSVPARSAAVPSNLPPLLEKHLTASQPWLATAPPERWFLQLLTTVAGRPDLVEEFLGRIQNAGGEMNKVRVYLSSLSGTPRYGVIYGDYVSRQDAVTDLDALPPAIKSRNPYARQVKQLR